MNKYSHQNTPFFDMNIDSSEYYIFAMTITSI